MDQDLLKKDSDNIKATTKNNDNITEEPNYHGDNSIFLLV